MRGFLETLSLILSLPSCLYGLSLEQRMQKMEKQLEDIDTLVARKVEEKLEDMNAVVATILEQELVDRYGMIRRCPLPSVSHGEVKCSKKDRKPGTTCKALCAPGYVTSSGSVVCQEGGQTWSGELRCEKEIPLLVVSGGSDSTSVEVINFHNGTGCDLAIPDIPKNEHGEVRLMHNMFYFPGSPFRLLVCNGLSKASKATCDSWTHGDSKWKLHSFPNKDETASFDRNMQELEKNGRYAASSFSWDGEHYIAGGMLNKGNYHKPTNNLREYKGTISYGKVAWRHNYYVGPTMNVARALFCIAQHNVKNFVAIGGHSGKVEKSVEAILGSAEIPDMETARNGHACVGIAGDVAKILVAGGSNTTHRSGEKALKTSEMFSADTNQWEQVGDMVHQRFGHALVNIGGRIIALGGKEWNPDVALKNAEEFDPSTKTWSSIGDAMKVPRSNFGYALIPHSAIPGCNINPGINVSGDIH